ncbi:MAG TPA: 50S ribosomal protein L6 [Patescibacteria group bacterium]|nr:50S ribosomal protein L6 [Patescibacteria group bacterium]
MSRIGKKPILIPQGVTVEINGDEVIVQGAKGQLSTKIRPEIKTIQSDGTLTFEVRRNTKNADSYWGLTRALVANMIAGVTQGFEKKLELVGVGYRAKPSGKGVSLSVGYSHPIEFPAPDGITIEVPDVQNIVVRGIDKQLVGLTASKIRKVRKPEPYKGKGIRYAGERVKRKAGKSGKV